MKILKFILLGLATLLALGLLALVVKFYVLSPKVRPPTEVKAPSTPDAIERGRYLANHVAGCIGCHSQVDEDQPGEPVRDGRIGSGRDFGDLPGFPGHMRAPNLTPDAETGIGNVSDGTILRAMREGIGRDGHVLFPFMPYRTFAKALSDADALAIIAYLRSLEPIKNKLQLSTVDFPVKMFVRALPEPVMSSPPGEPAATEPLARGEWLLTVASCHDCHDAFNDRHEPIAGKELAGGFPFVSPTGKGTVYAANITSDRATGIGAYTDEDLMRVFSQGVGKSGRTLYAMPWRYYAGMTDDDKRALISALRKISPVVNMVPADKILKP
jgi:hypothetical protein